MNTMHTTALFFVSTDIKDNNKFVFNNTQVVLLNRGKKYNSFQVSQNCDVKLFIYELTIQAPTYENALIVLDLIKCCFTTINSEQSINIEVIKINLAISFEKDLNRKNCYREMVVNSYFFGNDGLYQACKLASKIFGKSTKENAILKYDLARNLINFSPLELRPENDFCERVYSHSEQFMFAYAIVICYSILEELDIDIKASKQNPSTIKGDWNESVLNDLSERLKKNNIDGNSRITWLCRNNMARPFKNVLTLNKELCERSNNTTIFDFMIKISDAILEISFIRDKKASHGVGERIYDLTIYDVENAYSLIRTILFNYFEIDKVSYEVCYKENTSWLPCDYY